MDYCNVDQTIAEIRDYIDESTAKQWSDFVIKYDLRKILERFADSNIEHYRDSQESYKKYLQNIDDYYTVLKEE